MGQENQETENREQIVAFLERFAELNAELAEIFRTGNAALITDLNHTIKEMYRVQHGGEDDVFRAVDPDCDVIYQNFDMLVKVLRTTEDGEIDKGAQTAVNRFLHNITDACCNISALLGLI